MKKTMFLLLTALCLLCSFAVPAGKGVSGTRISIYPVLDYDNSLSMLTELNQKLLKHQKKITSKQLLDFINLPQPDFEDYVKNWSDSIAAEMATIEPDDSMETAVDGAVSVEPSPDWTSDCDADSIASDSVAVDTMFVDNSAASERIYFEGFRVACSDTATLSALLHLAQKRKLVDTSKYRFAFVPCYESDNSVRLIVLDLASPYAMKEVGVTSAEITEHQYLDAKELVFNMTRASGRAFENLTSVSVDNMVAVMVDGKVVSTPRVNTAITGSVCSISGLPDSTEYSRILARLQPSFVTEQPYQPLFMPRSVVGDTLSYAVEMLGEPVNVSPRHTFRLVPTLVTDTLCTYDYLPDSLSVSFVNEKDSVVKEMLDEFTNFVFHLPVTIEHRPVLREVSLRLLHPEAAIQSLQVWGEKQVIRINEELKKHSMPPMDSAGIVEMKNDMLYMTVLFMQAETYSTVFPEVKDLFAMNGFFESGDVRGERYLPALLGVAKYDIRQDGDETVITLSNTLGEDADKKETKYVYRIRKDGVVRSIDRVIPDETYSDIPSYKLRLLNE